MNPTIHDKLRVLRQRLAEMNPYPWEPVEAWIASATPLIKAHYREHFDDFATATATPNWCFLPRFSSGGGRWGEPRRDNFAEAAATEERENRKRAAAAKDKILAFVDGLLDLPALPTQPPSVLQGPRHEQPVTYYHHQGDVIMSGAKFNTTNTNSQFGAFGQGENVDVAGSLTISSTGSLTPDEHRVAIKEAQAALVHDQDALDQLDSRLYEALGQFLRLAREIQVEQKSLAEVQAKMKDTLDEVWAQQAAKGLRPQLLPRTLEIATALVKNPVMVEVVKGLLEA